MTSTKCCHACIAVTGPAPHRTVFCMDEKCPCGHAQPVSQEVRMCTSSDLHPYECDRAPSCVHCTSTKTDKHDPEKCWLCCDGDPATEKPKGDPLKLHPTEAQMCKSHPLCSHNTNGRDLGKPCSISFPPPTEAPEDKEAPCDCRGMPRPKYCPKHLAEEVSKPEDKEGKGWELGLEAIRQEYHYMKSADRVNFNQLFYKLRTLLAHVAEESRREELEGLRYDLARTKTDSKAIADRLIEVRLAALKKN